MKRKKKLKAKTQMDIMKSIRKPLPRPTKVINVKKYDRKNEDWKND